MKYIDKIDRFLLGQMSSEEESLFLQECKTRRSYYDSSSSTNFKTNNNMKCPTCGQEIGKFWSDENSMKEHGECFDCSLWRERLSLLGNPDLAIINGTLYTIGDEDDPSPSRGFGGDKFVINFKGWQKGQATATSEAKSRKSPCLASW